MTRIADELFTTLYKQYAGDVYSFALRLTNDRDDAEDVTAETFSRVLSSNVPIQTATVRGYLFTIARNIHLHRIRRSKLNAEIPANAISPESGPQRNAESSIALGRIQDRMSRLNEGDRTALILFAAEGFPYREVARILGISLAAVKIRIYRARQALADIRKMEEE